MRGRLRRTRDGAWLPMAGPSDGGQVRPVAVRLTRDLERTSPLASIQTYSAMMLPFWSSFMYLLTCAGQKRPAGGHVGGGGFAPSRSATRGLLC